MRTRTSLRAATLIVGAAGAVALAATTAFAAGSISYGDTGSAVVCVQSGLNLLDQAGLSTDGDFGTLTENAVKSFQSIHGLSQDGIVGPATGTAMKTTITTDANTANHAGHPNNDFDQWLGNCNSLVPGND
jgi:peptidoglycan hydrolase-like protein with peptidoglycan-binding domain